MAEEYRLKALLGLRERARQSAEEALAIAQNQQSAAERRLDASKRFRDDAAGRVREARENLYAGDGLTIGVIQGREAFLKRLQGELEDAEEAVTAAEGELKKAQREVKARHEALIQAKQDEEALLKHRESWEKEQKIVQRRREEDAADDVAQSLWLRKK